MFRSGDNDNVTGCLIWLSIILFIPICICVMTVLAGTNALAYRVYELVPGNLWISKPVKEAMGKWLNFESQEKYTDDEPYYCRVNGWDTLFQMLLGHGSRGCVEVPVEPEPGHIEGVEYDTSHWQQAMWSVLDCDKLEAQYGSTAPTVDCLNGGGFFDVNGNGILDDTDRAYARMTAKTGA